LDIIKKCLQDKVDQNLDGTKKVTDFKKNLDDKPSF
jgi:hypothetical protein